MPHLSSPAISTPATNSPTVAKEQETTTVLITRPAYFSSWVVGSVAIHEWHEARVELALGKRQRFSN
jgi:hypothetical protein